MMTQQFVNAINHAAEAAELLTDPAKQGEIWARIAQAIATANLVDVSRLESVTAEEAPKKEKEAAKKEPAKKEAAPKEKGDSMERKPRAKKEAAPVKEEKKEEAPAHEKVNDSDIPAEWNDELKERFSKELDTIMGIVDEFGEETINECVSTFMGGAKNVSLENINPRNVQAFAAFLKSLKAEYENDSEEVPF